MFLSESASMYVPCRSRRSFSEGGRLRQYLCRAAGGGDLLGCLAAELVRADGQLLRDVAAGEDLDAAGAADQAVLAEQLRRDVRTRLEPLGNRIEVHHRILDAEGIVEAALRHPAVQRHLAAFEPALVLEARTGLRPLVTASRRLAVARSLAAADPLLGVLGALGRLEIAEIH